HEAASAPPEKAARRPGKQGVASLTAMLETRGISFREQPPDANGVTWYHVQQCPFHDDGQPYECGVGQKLPNGACAGHCFHPEGLGKGWREWRTALGLAGDRDAGETHATEGYFASAAGLFWNKPTRDGSVATRL